MNWKHLVFSGLIVSSFGCGDGSDDTTPSTPDGEIKTIDGKADRWNYRNDAGHLRHELETNFDALPTEGYSAKIAWAASYWPMVYDGINHRWQGSSVLSPAEKYDKAFNNWSPVEDFMNYKPVDLTTCEFDQEYYDNLGPAALYTTKNNGNFRVVDGVDGDNDGTSDAEECQNHNEDWDDWDGLEGWFGICHAWAPASLMEDEPLKAVERNGITFEVSDIKALLIQQYDRTSAYSVGGRCYDTELDFDENGRVTNDECRDLNAGSWHLAVTNLLGENGAPLVIERTTNYQVWNQPMLGYEVTEQREITLVEALELLNLDTTGEDPQGTGEFVHGVEEGSAEAQAMLHFANSATFTELDDDARLYRTAASYIAYYRPFANLTELDEVPYVGLHAFTNLNKYVVDNDLVGAGSLAYQYNPDAVKFVEIRMTTDWVTESHPSVRPTSDDVERYTRHDYYHYILELDADSNIIGGEWVGSSKANHPDFIWRPLVAVSGNPNISLDTVREMVAESREDVVVDPDGDLLSFSSTDVVAIPDNDPVGATSAIEVDATGTIKSVSVDVDIAHTYRGDLLVELRFGPQVVTVYDGRNAESPWSDDVNLAGVSAPGFEGSQVNGTWELLVTDSAGYDVGEIVSWTLNVETE